MMDRLFGSALAATRQRFVKLGTAMLSAMVPVFAVAEGGDPITAILSRDWASVTGWGLFFMLATLITLGNFREWWVPGPRYRRLEDSATRQSETLATTVKTLEEQVKANEITKHFFEETAPRRRDADT